MNILFNALQEILISRAAVISKDVILVQTIAEAIQESLESNACQASPDAIDLSIV